MTTPVICRKYYLWYMVITDAMIESAAWKYIQENIKGRYSGDMLVKMFKAGYEYSKMMSVLRSVDLKDTIPPVPEEGYPGHLMEEFYIENHKEFPGDIWARQPDGRYYSKNQDRYRESWDIYDGVEMGILEKAKKGT